MLWGISWINIQLMQDDSARTVDTPDDESKGEAGGGKVEHRELKTKEDIKNYVKGLL